MISKENKCRILFNGLTTLKKAGFFNIFNATLLNSIVSFVYGIFIIRLLTKADYGAFSYAQNILSFGFMFCCLGGNVGLLQFCSEPIELQIKYSYCKLAGKMGMVGSAVVPIIMMAYVKLDRSEIPNLTLYVAELMLLPFFYFLKEWVAVNLRWQFKNREYGIVLNTHSILNMILAVLGAFIGGIQGVIVGMYLAYISAGACGLFYLKSTVLRGIRGTTEKGKIQSKNFLNYSFVMCIVNALISMLFMIDTFVIGNIMKDAEQIAMYKAACTIPFALNMVPNSIMQFACPHIAYHKNESNWIKKNIALVYMANGIVNVVIGTILIAVAPLLISVLYGDSYKEIISVFRIMLVAYILNACFRTPAANLLAILKMPRTALVVSLATIFISVMMSTIMVSKYGIQGAAWGTAGTFSIVGLVSTSIVIYKIYGKWLPE